MLDRSAPRRLGHLPRLGLAITASLLALAAVPALAGACPSVSHVKSFSGTATVTFAQTVSGEYEPGPTYLTGKSTVKINQKAQGLQLHSLRRRRIRHSPGLLPGAAFIGQTRGGAIAVDDGIVDITEDGELAKGMQIGAGPATTGLTGKPTESWVVLSPPDLNGPLACKYQLGVGFEILTTISSSVTEAGESLPIDDADRRLNFLSVSPPSQIPGDFHLKGTAAIPVSVQPKETSGYYSVVEPEWGDAFKTILDEEEIQENTATFSWDLQPRFAKAHK